jgi:hypothetical protein
LRDVGLPDKPIFPSGDNVAAITADFFSVSEVITISNITGINIEKISTISYVQNIPIRIFKVGVLAASPVSNQLRHSFMQKCGAMNKCS